MEANITKAAKVSAAPAAGVCVTQKHLEQNEKQNVQVTLGIYMIHLVLATGVWNRLLLWGSFLPCLRTRNVVISHFRLNIFDDYIVWTG